MKCRKSPVSVVIVTFQSAEVIATCVQHAIQAAEEVIVVDNHSQDATLERVRRFASVKVIASSRNLGFAGAVNQGVAAASQPNVLLLNPDAILLEGLEDLVRALEQPGVGAVSGRLCDASGRFQLGFGVRRLPTAGALALECLGWNRLFAENAVNRRYRHLDFDPELAQEVEQPAGAFLLFRKEVHAALGGFDERFYPLWFEDVDFCKRLKDRGLKILYEPKARAIHQGAHSVGKLTWEHKVQYWYASLLGYSVKHFTRPGVVMVAVAVAGGAVIKALLGIFALHSLKPVWIYGKVIRLACRYLFPPVTTATKAVLEKHS